MIGNKVLINHDGMSEEELRFEAVGRDKVHTVTNQFHRDCYTFKKGDIGVVEDLSATGTYWKIRIKGRKELAYVPLEWVSKIPDTKKIYE